MHSSGLGHTLLYILKERLLLSLLRRLLLRNLHQAMLGVPLSCVLEVISREGGQLLYKHWVLKQLVGLRSYSWGLLRQLALECSK